MFQVSKFLDLICSHPKIIPQWERKKRKGNGKRTPAPSMLRRVGHQSCSNRSPLGNKRQACVRGALGMMNFAFLPFHSKTSVSHPNIF